MSHPEYINVGHPFDKLIEECSELIQALCKARRFGLFSHHPDYPNRTNISDIKREMDDVNDAMESVMVLIRQETFEFYKNEK